MLDRVRDLDRVLALQHPRQSRRDLDLGTHPRGRVVDGVAVDAHRGDLETDVLAVHLGRESLSELRDARGPLLERHVDALRDGQDRFAGIEFDPRRDVHRAHLRVEGSGRGEVPGCTRSSPLVRVRHDRDHGHGADDDEHRQSADEKPRPGQEVARAPPPEIVGAELVGHAREDDLAGRPRITGEDGVGNTSIGQRRARDQLRAFGLKTHAQQMLPDEGPPTSQRAR